MILSFALNSFIGYRSGVSDRRRVSGRAAGMAPEASIYCTGEAHMRQKYDLILEHSFVVLRLPQNVWFPVVGRAIIGAS
jgi:hypothetical protein